ncbi:MAG: hypothetical protein IH843_06360 [Thaumarchaeota archaeon]|nr:hypothetical protein [Nitrososphaerota archaeon]
MNQKTKKYTGLLAILPLFLVAIAPYYIGAADAIEGPQVEVTKIIQKGENSYYVTFKVYAGSEDLPAGKLLVTSDVTGKEALFRSVTADSFTSTDRIQVTANDPSSIVAQVVKTTSKAIPELAVVSQDSETGFYIERTSVIQEGDNAYDVSFKIFAGNEDVSQGKLVVTSDTSESEVLFSGISANSFTSTNQIRIAADDPSTISAEYVMVEPEVDIRTANKYTRQN